MVASRNEKSRSVAALVENAEMTFTGFLLWKLIALGALAFFGNLFYALFTGKTLEEARRDIRQKAEHPERQD